MSPLWRRSRSEVETCETCGFDSRVWRVPDAVTLLSALGEWWRLATEGIDARALNQRPRSEVWSVAEYGVHVALVLAVLRTAVDEILAEDGVTLPEAPAASGAAADDEAADLDPRSVLADLRREAEALAAVAGDASPDVWKHTGSVGGEKVTAKGALFHAVHDASHHLMDVGRGLAVLGAGTPAHGGTVTQINTSEGGVPKRPVAGGTITAAGLAGDRQADRKHHGRPFQALCLWSSEVIAELAADGHPIEPGFAGENLTLSGVRWADLRPGTTLRIGTAEAELFYPAVPCAKQAGWFTDGDFSRLHHENHPEWTRWYGWVRKPGEVRPGSEVVVQPPDG